MALIAKSRGKSLVWMYFGLKADAKGRPLNNGQCVCRLCQKIVLAKNGNTTNLRSHLRRRHRAKFSSSSAAFQIPVSNSEELPDIPHLQNVSSQNYIPDAALPPGEPWLQGGPTRAVLSLPSCLCLCEDIAPVVDGTGCVSEQLLEEIKVYGKRLLEPGVLFGPYLGEMCKERTPTQLKYAWAIRDEAAFTYIDAADENKSNWMRYVTYARTEEEHNLVVFQFFRHIYYKVTQQITKGTELKVWIGRDYATLLGLAMDDNIKCEVGDKETVLQLLQDIQLVTLPEPNSSVWSDLSQSESSMALMSDTSAMSNLESLTDTSTLHLSHPLWVQSTPSSSLISCPPSGYNTTVSYDFMPGSETLLCAPNTPTHSPWFFVGFEPDASGLPVDPSAVVCKLCRDVVSCGGGPADVQNHLLKKHNIKTCDPSSDQTGLQDFAGLLPSTLHNLSSAIISFLIMDLQPLSLIEGQGFKELIQTLVPSYNELPTYSQLNNLLKYYYFKGKQSLAHVLKRKEKMPNHTAPIDFDSPRHSVVLSVDIWLHSWHGNTEQYLTLWAHYVDSDFTFQNMALTTQRLVESGTDEPSIHAVETQVRAIAQEWDILQPSVILVGGEGRRRMWPQPPSCDGGNEASESQVHPNSTTFLEREDSMPFEEPNDLEQDCSGAGCLLLPCFFRVMQDCIEEVMTHPIISKTLDRFQSFLSAVFLPVAQAKNPNQTFNKDHLQILTKPELAGLKSWAYNRPGWNKLYPLLGILIKHKRVLSEMIRDMKCVEPSSEDTMQPGTSTMCQTNSTSSSSCAVLCSEWKVLEDLSLVLRPLDVACQTLAKESFPRLSLIKPILTGLLSHHLVLQQSDSTSILTEVKTMMRKRLSCCYSSFAVNKALCVACAVDPQFNGLGFMSVKEQTATFDWLKKEAVRIVKGVKMDKSRSPSFESDGIVPRRSKRVKRSHKTDFVGWEELEERNEEVVEKVEKEASEDSHPSQERVSGLEFLLGDLYSSSPKSKQSSLEESIDVEVSVYRSSKLTVLGVDPLEWWSKKAAQFPLLETVARAYLAIPAVAGNAVHDYLQEDARSMYKKRDKVPPESLESVLFLHHNRMFNGELADGKK